MRQAVGTVRAEAAAAVEGARGETSAVRATLQAREKELVADRSVAVSCVV
jgi:hypothetical protein